MAFLKLAVVIADQIQLSQIIIIITSVLCACAGTGAYAARVTIAPQTVVALVDASATAQFTCEVRDAVGLDWLLNGTHDSNVAGAVSKTDFSVSGGAAVFSSSLIVLTAEEFDSLQVVCRARGSSESESSDSDAAWLLLEAPLVTPHNIEVLYDTDLIFLTWTCGVAEHVELHYKVTISRDTDKNTEYIVMQTDETLISFGLDHPFAELCTNYTFSVVAWSVLDTSDPSEPVTAGFPCPLPSVSAPPTLHVVGTIPEPDIDSATPGINATPGPSTDEERKNAAEIIIIIVTVLAMITMLLLSAAIMVLLVCKPRWKAGTYEMKEKGKEVALRFFEEETVA